MGLVARIRSIKPGYSTSEAIAELSLGCELHFIKLWTYCDDHGRAPDNPRLIKAAIWPLRDDVTIEQITKWQDELEKHDRIVRYTVNGKALFEVCNWSEHQKPQHPKESEWASSDSDEAIRKPHEDFSKPNEDEVTVVGEGVVDVEVVVVGEVGILPDAEQTFPEFWETYPRHHQTGKPGGGAVKAETLKRWKKLTHNERDLCLDAVRNYASALSLPGAEFPKHALTWLNQRVWEDWADPAPLHLARGPDGPRDPFAEMGQRLLGGKGASNGTTDSSTGETRRSLPAGPGA